MNARAIAAEAMSDMKGLLKMISQRKIDERRAGGGEFHAGGEPALHQRKIAGREMAIQIGDESPHLDALGRSHGRRVDARAGDDDHAQVRKLRLDDGIGLEDAPDKMRADA